MVIKTIICDVDGCLVHYPNEPYHSTWDALADVCLDKKKWFGLRKYYAGKVNLEEDWFIEQVKLLKGVEVKEAEKYLFPIPYSKGVKEFFLGENNFLFRGIVSAGINLVIDEIVKDLGFDFSVRNELEVKEGRLTGRGNYCLNLYRKDVAVKKIAKEKNLNLEETMYVGDTSSDIPAFNAVGIGVAYNPKSKEAARKADYVINDFRELRRILIIENEK